MFVGEAAQVDVSGNFSDPDGDAPGYAATTSDAGVATASASGSAVTVSGVSHGTADVTVAETDPGGLSATQALAMTVRLSDREVLEILYDELDGDNWRINSDWLTDAPLDEWYGVSTDADGRVHTLRLRSNFLTGAIPLELGSLLNLESLALGSNPLTGEIPPELAELSNLEDLGLYANELTGEIPPELASLSNLESLALGSNPLTGEIPPELGDLPNLEHLGLWDTSLTGEIPPELGRLSNLEELYPYNNSLTGEIPPDFLDLSLLWRFYWDDNDGLCAPDTSEFDDWLDGIDMSRGPRCD